MGHSWRYYRGVVCWCGKCYIGSPRSEWRNGHWPMDRDPGHGGWDGTSYEVRN